MVGLECHWNEETSRQFGFKGSVLEWWGVVGQSAHVAGGSHRSGLVSWNRTGRSFAVLTEVNTEGIFG